MITGIRPVSKEPSIFGLAHPFALGIYGSLLGFALVFRLNMAMARYREGVESMESCMCKWKDSAMQIIAFANCSRIKWHDDAAVLERLEQFKEVVIHWFSLLSAVNMNRLKETCQRDPEEDAPQFVSRQTKSMVLVNSP